MRKYIAVLTLGLSLGYLQPSMARESDNQLKAYSSDYSQHRGQDICVLNLVPDLTLGKCINLGLSSAQRLKYVKELCELNLIENDLTIYKDIPLYCFKDEHTLHVMDFDTNQGYIFDTNSGNLKQSEEITISKESAQANASIIKQLMSSSKWEEKNREADEVLEYLYASIEDLWKIKTEILTAERSKKTESRSQELKYIQELCKIDKRGEIKSKYGFVYCSKDELNIIIAVDNTRFIYSFNRNSGRLNTFRVTDDSMTKGVEFSELYLSNYRNFRANPYFRMRYKPGDWRGITNKADETLKNIYTAFKEGPKKENKSTIELLPKIIDRRT